MSRFTRFAVVVPALILTVAAGSPFAESVQLPDDFAPESVAVGTGSTFYVGSLADGDVYRGDLRSGNGAVFIDAPAGRQAAGLKVDESRHRLFVAGGATGHAYVYDTRDGASIADLQLASSSALLNDVVVTKRAAYFTDSFNPVLYRVPIAPDGTLGEPETVTLSGPASAIIGFPNLNGIAATPAGDKLVVGHSLLGALFIVDPVTGASQPIELIGGALTPGPVDGILLDGHTLWVVENFTERLVEIRLSPDLSNGQVTSVLTDAGMPGLFRVPTAVAEHGNRLAILNARFDLGLPPPFGTGAPPGTDYDLTLLEKP